MLTEAQQQGLDIDWFFTNNEDIAFAASAGGRLPESISKASEDYGMLSNYFRSLPEISEILVNVDLREIKGLTIDDRYIEDFVHMTKRGLFSFDRTILNNFNDTRYHIVAKPISPLKLTQLPSEIKDILINSRYVGNMNTFLDSAFIR